MKNSPDSIIAVAAASHADLLMRITEIIRVLKIKGLITDEELKASMTDSQRNHFILRAGEKFLEDVEKAARAAREEGLFDGEP